MPLQGAKLSIIVPTYNEGGNVNELIKRLDKSLGGISWEVIFVDDNSPDGTANLARKIARTDSRVRCIQRIGRRGLSSACIEGMLASSADYLSVIDGDLQHDERLLPKMFSILQDGDTDIVIGSRYIAMGGIADWDQTRASISQFSTRMSQLVVRANISDPMSGFFMISREVFAESVYKLSGIGFKILLDLFASSPRPLRFKELPYQFRNRHAGESKLDSQAAWDYGMLILDKLIGRIIPLRFIAFGLVGSLGVFVHMLTLFLLYKILEIKFVPSQSIATLVAMSFNFTLNNALTYRDMRLRGWLWLRGWCTFCIACSIGAFANIGIATYLSQKGSQWLLSGFAGIIVGAVWNFAVTKVFTWKSK